MTSCASLSGGSCGYAAQQKVLAVGSRFSGSQLSLRGCHHRAGGSGSSRQKSREKVEGRQGPGPY